MEKIDIIWCTSNEVKGLLFERTKPFACWLYIHRTDICDLSEILQHLANLNCALIYISGENANIWHQEIDDYLLEIGRDDILTAWSDENISECAEQFWDIARHHYCRLLLSAVANSQAKECLYSSEILSVLSKQFL